MNTYIYLTIYIYITHHNMSFFVFLGYCLAPLFAPLGPQFGRRLETDGLQPANTGSYGYGMLWQFILL